MGGFRLQGGCLVGIGIVVQGFGWEIALREGSAPSKFNWLEIFKYAQLRYIILLSGNKAGT